MSDADENKRRVAVSSLRFFRGTEAREAAEKALTDPSSTVRCTAEESVEKMADPRCVPARARALHDESPLVVSAAIQMISALGDDSAVPPLLELLKTGNKEVRAEICLWIGKMHLARPNVVGDALLPLLEDSDAQTRLGAAAALGAFRERRAIPRSLQMIHEPVDPKSAGLWIQPQIAMIIALGKIGDSSTIPQIAQLLDTPSTGEASADALMNIGDPAAATFLLDHYIRTADDQKLLPVHRKEIEALGKLGTAETRGALEEYLTKCPPPRKGSVRKAIAGIDRRLPC